MAKRFVNFLGKSVQQLTKLRGGGTALPGLFVEKIDPQFVKHTLQELPHGVVIISGTNGKTTTTKIAVELLEGQGLKVFTNRTGSNFSRGVAAALLSEVDSRGKLDADIAVLELDEAHAVHFARAIQPRYSLLLNVMRDQLDRFSEIDMTAQLLSSIAQETTDGVILNREDSRVAAIAKEVDVPVSYFGLSETLRSTLGNLDSEVRTSLGRLPYAVVTLDELDEATATFTFHNKTYSSSLLLQADYNIYNAAGALALVEEVLKKSLDTKQLFATLETIKPAFGRGESFTVNGQQLDVILVKNPSGFQSSLRTFFNPDADTLLAVNDNYADGRDVSWLWDVDFTCFRQNGVSHVTGVRAYDMALRLQYDEVAISSITPSIKESLRDFLALHPDTPKQIFCTYTAMRSVRRELQKMPSVKVAS